MARAKNLRDLGHWRHGLRNTKHDELVKKFTLYHSDWGDWYFEVPVAPFKKVRGSWSPPRNKVDAVCVLGSGGQYRHSPYSLTSGVKWAESWWEKRFAAELFEGSEVALVEVKAGNLSSNALGQLLAYWDMFSEGWNADVVECWAITTDVENEDLIDVFLDHEIGVIIIPDGDMSSEEVYEPEED